MQRAPSQPQFLSYFIYHLNKNTHGLVPAIDLRDKDDLAKLEGIGSTFANLQKLARTNPLAARLHERMLSKLQTAHRQACRATSSSQANSSNKVEESSMTWNSTVVARPTHPQDSHPSASVHAMVNNSLVEVSDCDGIVTDGRQY